jgi:hypothetical protein
MVILHHGGISPRRCLPVVSSRIPALQRASWIVDENGLFLDSPVYIVYSIWGHASVEPAFRGQGGTGSSSIVVCKCPFIKPTAIRTLKQKERA